MGKHLFNGRKEDSTLPYLFSLSLCALLSLISSKSQMLSFFFIWFGLFSYRYLPGTTMGRLTFQMMCQFSNQSTILLSLYFAFLWLYLLSSSLVEAQWLPVYTPNAREKQDATLYATNVRRYMSKIINLPVTNHTFEDMFLMQEAIISHETAEAVNVSAKKIQTLLQVCFCFPISRVFQVF